MECVHGALLIRTDGEISVNQTLNILQTTIKSIIRNVNIMAQP